MNGKKGFPDASEFIQKYQNIHDLKREVTYWYKGDDPVVLSVVHNALTRLGQRLLSNQNTETFQKVVDKISELLEATKDWPDVRNAGSAFYGAVGSADFSVIDAVDHLMAIYYAKPWKNLGIPVEDLMMLVTLREAKANRPSVAIKAFFVSDSVSMKSGYRKYIEIMSGRQKGGRKSGKTKREENKKRDDSMREESIRLLGTGEDKVKIIAMFASRYNLGKDRIRQILSEHSKWPTRKNKKKRNHT